MSPAVSVIIPVYNGTDYLREAIDSVLLQTFTDYELLVIDDGSTDNTWKLIQSYGSRLRGIRKLNGGVASALNVGIQHARAQWIAWLSHDDAFLPIKLERQVAFLRHNPRFRACYTWFYDIDGGGKIVGENKPAWYPRQQATRVLFHNTYMNGSTMLIDRACFDTAGLFNEKLRNTQDVEMWIRLVQHFDVGQVPEILLRRRVHPAQGSRNYRVQMAEEQATFTRLFSDLGVAGIFPEAASYADGPQMIAWGYEWLGDTMRIYRHWYAYAKDQYRRSVAIWPSWRNTARPKIAMTTMLNSGRLGYRRIRSILSTSYRRRYLAGLASQ